MNLHSDFLLLQRSTPAQILPRLVPSGTFFKLETGERFTVKMCSDFNLLNRWQHGEDIRHILEQRAAVGFNFLRVWTAFDIPLIGTFLDINYLLIPKFLALCASYGFYVELTAYTGINDPNHWGSLYQLVRDTTNVLVELVNELDQNEDEPDYLGRVFHLEDYARLPDVLCSHGSNGSDKIGVRPWWDYEDFHTNDAFEWWRKPGHGAMVSSEGDKDVQASRVPCIASENTRFTDKDSNLQHANDAGEAGALLCGGTCFHSVSGKTSSLFAPDEFEAAKIWVGGANKVPLRFQAGQYRHAQETEQPDDMRNYQRVLDTGEAYTVKVKK